MEMVTGYVLINAAPGKIGRVFRDLGIINEIVEKYPIFGEYDIIIKTETRDFDMMGPLIVDRVRSINGVVNTKTLTAVKI